MSDVVSIKAKRTVSKRSTSKAAAKRKGGAEKEVKKAASRAAHVEKITEAWGGFVEAWGAAVPFLVSTGQRLGEAKKDLGHGQFGEMIASDLPFSARTAQRLMQIARSPTLADPSHGTHLPTDTHTLAMLATAPEPKLRTWLEKGIVTPRTEQQDVKKLLHPNRPTTRTADPATAEASQALATVEVDTSSSRMADVLQFKRLLEPRLGAALLERIVARAAHDRKDLIYFTAGALRFYVEHGPAPTGERDAT